MKFENAHEMTTDGVAGPGVWKALLEDAIAGKQTGEPYSYVYVHRAVPETATLWSAGRTLVKTPANSGVPGAETELGTFPVFEHIPEGTMTGTNPDGSHYVDPGIKWISYFNGGDALHYYVRGSYGFPQSNGCIEMPLGAAAAIWPVGFFAIGEKPTGSKDPFGLRRAANAILKGERWATVSLAGLCTLAGGRLTRPT